MTDAEATRRIRAILPPGFKRSEATINGHHVKRQAARYVIDGRRYAYSVDDAVRMVSDD